MVTPASLQLQLTCNRSHPLPCQLALLQQQLHDARLQVLAKEVIMRSFDNSCGTGNAFTSHQVVSHCKQTMMYTDLQRVSAGFPGFFVTQTVQSTLKQTVEQDAPGRAAVRAATQR